MSKSGVEPIKKFLPPVTIGTYAITLERSLVCAVYDFKANEEHLFLDFESES